MLRHAVSHILHREPGPPPAKSNGSQHGSPSAYAKALEVEVIQMFRKEQGPSSPQHACLGTVQVGDVEEKESVRMKQLAASAKEPHRVRHVFQNIPQGNRVEAALEVSCLQGRAVYFAFAVQVLSSLFAQLFIGLDASNLPALSNSLRKEEARSAADVKQTPRGHVSMDNLKVFPCSALTSFHL